MSFVSRQRGCPPPAAKLVAAHHFSFPDSAAATSAPSPPLTIHELIENAYPYAAANGCAGQRVPPADATPRMARVLR
jgi:hypothetical protein